MGILTVLKERSHWRNFKSEKVVTQIDAGGMSWGMGQVLFVTACPRIFFSLCPRGFLHKTSLCSVYWGYRTSSWTTQAGPSFRSGISQLPPLNFEVMPQQSNCPASNGLWWMLYRLHSCKCSKPAGQVTSYDDPTALGQNSPRYCGPPCLSVVPYLCTHPQPERRLDSMFPDQMKNSHHTTT